VWIKGSQEHTAELIRRFDRAPKPMYYRPDFLAQKWDEYLELKAQSPDQVDPDAFVRWTYAQALAHRQPLYQGMARWGVTVTADQIAQVKTPQDFNQLIEHSLETQQN
jgi:hypothetical protein